MVVSNAAKELNPAAIPEPKGFWNSVLTTLPIVLTILATAFAGMSSSEMTQAMYYRSLAAQHQSKAGDQWAFFQAKRIRGTSLEMTAELLQSLAVPGPFDPSAIDSDSSKLAALLEKLAQDKGTDDATRKQAVPAAASIEKTRTKLKKLLAADTIESNLPYLRDTTLPETESSSLKNTDAQKAIDVVVIDISKRKTEVETADAVKKLSPADIEEATRLAEQNADNFDKACRPINDMIDQFRSVFAELTAAVQPFRRSGATEPIKALLAALDRLNTDYRLAAIKFDANRYRQESFYNRKAAELYEVRVRRSGVESDRHRMRSQMFFFSMLVAQVGVTIASLALARTQRKSLWLFAALAGLIAVGFSSYVYVTL